LEDGGAEVWAATINKVKEVNPNIKIETLIPDFREDYNDLQTVIDAKPEVISHNLETVERLTPMIRSVAKYQRSLNVLKYIADKGVVAKSGIMLGLGETEEEIYKTMDDLLEFGVSVLTIGQYLAPTKEHLQVSKYYTPEEFDKYKEVGLGKGIKFVESSPLVRSSYRAEVHVE
jgi:lipoic acid synthetase